MRLLKTIVFALFSVALSATVTVHAGKSHHHHHHDPLFSHHPPSEMELKEMFIDFIKEFQKKYPHQQSLSRFEAFKMNVEQIHMHNINRERNNATYSMGVNQFSDLTPAEFKSLYHGYRRSDKRVLKENLHSIRGDAPPSIDCRLKNAVTAIKDQYDPLPSPPHPCLDRLLFSFGVHALCYLYE